MNNGADGLDACLACCRLLSLSDCTFSSNAGNGAALKQTFRWHQGKTDANRESKAAALRILHTQRPGKEFEWKYVAVFRSIFDGNKNNHVATQINQEQQWSHIDDGSVLQQTYSHLFVCHNSFSGKAKNNVTMLKESPWTASTEGGFRVAFVVPLVEVDIGSTDAQHAENAAVSAPHPASGAATADVPALVTLAAGHVLVHDPVLLEFLNRVECDSMSVRAAGDALREAVAVADTVTEKSGALDACCKLAEGIPNYAAAVVAELVGREGCRRVDGGKTAVVSPETAATWAAQHGAVFSEARVKDSRSSSYCLTFTKERGIVITGFKMEGVRLDFVECEGIDVNDCSFVSAHVAFAQCRCLRVGSCTFDNSKSGYPSVVFRMQTSVVLLEDVSIKGQQNSGDNVKLTKVDGIKFHSDSCGKPSMLDIIGVRRVSSINNGSDGLDACVACCRLFAIADSTFTGNTQDGTELKQSFRIHQGINQAQLDAKTGAMRILHAVRPGKEFEWKYIAVLRNTYAGNKGNNVATQINQEKQWKVIDKDKVLRQSYSQLFVCHNSFSGKDKIIMYREKPWSEATEGGFSKTFIVPLPGAGKTHPAPGTGGGKGGGNKAKGTGSWRSFLRRWLCRG